MRRGRARRAGVPDERRGPEGAHAGARSTGAHAGPPSSGQAPAPESAPGGHFWCSQPGDAEARSRKRDGLSPIAETHQKDIGHIQGENAHCARCFRAHALLCQSLTEVRQRVRSAQTTRAVRAASSMVHSIRTNKTHFCCSNRKPRGSAAALPRTVRRHLRPREQSSRNVSHGRRISPRKSCMKQKQGCCRRRTVPSRCHVCPAKAFVAANAFRARARTPARERATPPASPSVDQTVTLQRLHASSSSFGIKKSGRASTSRTAHGSWAA